MEQSDVIFHVVALTLEVATMLRLCYVLCKSQSWHSLSWIHQRFLAWWNLPTMNPQTSKELDAFRCRMTCRVWNVLFLASMVRLVAGQILMAMGLSRTAPDFDYAFYSLAIVGFLLSCKPELITPKTLDVWFVATGLLWIIITLGLFPNMDVREFLILSIGVRFVLTVLAKRAWCVVLIFVSGALLLIRNAALHSSGALDELLTLTVSCGLALMFAAIFTGRRLLQEYAVLKLDLRVRTVELGAVSSLLTACYDAVVEVDDSLKLTDHSRQLSTMLLHSGPRDSRGLEGRCLLDIFSEEDQARISHQFQASISSESTSVMALNADMLDADQNRVKVELFHAQFRNLSNQRCFLVGVRELQFNEQVEALPATPALTAFDGELSITFEVSSFDVLHMTEDMERLCQTCLGKIPENILEISSAPSRPTFCETIQELVNKCAQDLEEQDQVLSFKMLGIGPVTCNFFMQHDVLLDMLVAILNVQPSRPEQVVDREPKAQVLGRRSRGSNTRDRLMEGSPSSGLISKLHRTTALWKCPVQTRDQAKSRSLENGKFHSGGTGGAEERWATWELEVDLGSGIRKPCWY